MADNNFWGPATTTDPVPNADVDAALGYGRDPNDDFMTAFGKAFQAGQFRNTDEGRKLTADFAKQKLANQLAEQLMQRKYELAQKYEPYSHFFNLPNGSVVGVGQQGAKEMYSNPEMKGVYQAETAAKVAEANTKAKPEYQQAELDAAVAKPGFMKAQEEYMTGARTREAEARANAANAAAATRGKPKPLTPAQEEQIQKIALQNLYPGYQPGKPFSNRQFQQDQKAGVLDQKLRDEVDRVRQTFQQQPQASGIAAPGAAQAPDLTGAFSPLSVDD